MTQSYFIAGTDTNIGKTIVTALLTHYFLKQNLDVGVYKPIQSGAIKDTHTQQLLSPDLETIKDYTHLPDTKLKTSYLFKAPLAPMQAALADNQSAIDPSTILSDYQEFAKQNDITLVEGIGGIKVPITNDYYIDDLIKDLNIPVIIVSRPNLGTINHTLLTIESLKQKSIPITGIIYNEPSRIPKSDVAAIQNPSVIEKLTGIPTLGIIPYQDNLELDKLTDKLTLNIMVSR